MTVEVSDIHIDDILQSVGGEINVTTARQELAERIMTAIAIGTYSPGEQLPSERELAEQQGVSRVTVRGALEIVREHGLLCSRRGRGGGTFVTDIDVNQATPGTTLRMLGKEIPRLKAFVDFRCLIAGLEARTAAERRSEEQVRTLNTILNRFLATDDIVEARKIDIELHNFVTTMAGNKQLASLIAQLNMKATLGFRAEPYLPEYLERVRAEHGELTKAIIDQDLERAFQAAYHHFSITFTIIENAYQRATSSR
ncbi:hypothetical protein BGC31_07235 [Komagataeibacter xylinus]|nr:hypothetical protein BGC31_07235 [Komagataeibacter xylinus]RFP04007.1 hypothetical protein BFX83_09320 [Komagataeibacter xylinus]